MNDFDNLLASDYGFKATGKSAPMAPPPKGSSNFPTTTANFDSGSRSSRTSNSLNSDFMVDTDSIFGSSGSRKNRDAGGFGDLFGGKSDDRGADAPFNLDSMFPGSGGDFGSKAASSPPPPVYDKPVYDDDIFNGVPGLKSTSKVQYDDVFTSVASEGGGGAFDDLLGGFGKESKSSGWKRSEKDDKGSVPDFDDLLAGFGSSTRPSSERKWILHFSGC